ncbi:MAG: ABC transporter substrate-binding protein [Deltaproteobacteria bacterium]|nr:ABC transporter substrate-binding protein [Deltaproteobacteria bacterium]MBW2345883.1 ABC transporter substrate-binding protein [Deltaproteobacteria bacterium]
MRRYLRFVVLVTTPILICLIFFGCEAKNRKFHIGVLQWTEKIQAFNKTYKGVLDGLNDKGYRQGINLEIDYRNAGQDKNLALKIARGFVKKDVDLIVALGTGSSLAALEATQKEQIPIVFSIVGAPKATGIIRDYDDPGRNITGVSMKVPVKEQFEIIKEVLPGVKKLGIIYCTDMSQAVATGKEAAAVAPEFGWTQLTVSFPKEELPQLQKMAQSLAQKVDAIYIPTDPILGLPKNLGTITRISDEYKIPVVVVTEKFVEAGGLMSVHCDFYEIGRQAAGPIVQVLTGVDAQTIPSQKPIINRISLNLKKAQELNLEIKRNVILKADNIFD